MADRAADMDGGGKPGGPTLGARIEAARRVGADGRITDASLREIAAIQAGALREVIADKNERAFVLAGGEQVAISDIRAPHEGGGDPLCFHLEVWDADGRLIHADDHVVFNPPVMVQTGVEADGVTPVIEAAPRTAFRGIVDNLVASARARGAAR